MRLRYTKKDGTQMEFELGEKPITIGRSPEADVVVLDEKASRIHCGVRLWDGEFYIKDLKSRNGTFVNDQRIEVAKLKPSDRIRIGSISFLFEQDPTKSTGVALQEMEQEMAQGKGYSTILQEIVGKMDDQPPQEAGASAAPQGAAEEGEPIRIKARKKPKT
ncbi:MAG TPA: FHA domain-containing protein [Kiritimatiellia bacterium]|nr:FHA domain-containing protein [Kiritimatiellia bacterium]